MNVQKQAVGGYRLSPQQKHLWHLQQSDRIHSYLAECCVMIDGLLDLYELKAAVRLVVQRYEILHTCFMRLPEMDLPVQVVTNGAISLDSSFDLSGLPPEHQETRMQELMRQMAQAPSDLENGPPGRFSFITLSPEKHAMLICLPALCADSASLKNLVREISCRYGIGLSPQPPEDPIQYVDLSEWQNEMLEAEDLAPGRSYWRKQGSSAAASLKLFFEKPAAGERSFEPQSLKIDIDAATQAGLEAVASCYELSGSVLLLTCWQVLLWHNTRQSEITVGVAYDGRNYEELQEAMGLFARHLPLQCYLEEASRFLDVAASVEEAARQAYRWQECFTWDDLPIPANDSEALPFFPICFEYVDKMPKLTANLVSFSILNQHAYFDRFKLKLSCVEVDASLAAEFHYDQGAFAKEDIQSLTEQFHSLLQNVISTPEAMLCELTPLSGAQRFKLLIEFNDTDSDYAQEVCAHHLFEKQAERSPGSIAIVFGQQRVTYSMLNARANQLANYLLKLGVGPDALVGLLLERSTDMVTALLGVLKAGGAYVPLDTSYPKQRISFVLQDTQMSVVITQESLVSALPEGPARLICIDAEWERISEEDPRDLKTRVCPDHLAYVIYTSGSTGKPKGVMIPHAGLTNYLSWSAKAYGIERGKGSIVHSPIAFDLTITSLLLPLIMGHSIRLLAEDGIDELSAAIRERDDCGLIKLTPAHLNALNQMMNNEQPSSRTMTMVIGGEALFSQAVELWRSHWPQTRFINEYGPTETVVGCCVYEIAKDERLEGVVPIGKPIANAQIYVLDGHLYPVPVGVVGELYIGGDGLARGYLNSGDLTAERFIPNPFSAERGKRLYKTGDLARHLPNGNIQYVGRIDNQVKVRGYRIELGEIEAVLCQHPAVEEAVVAARDYEANEKRLVAYLVAASQQAASSTQLREFMRDRLPEYMVPSAFVALGHLPLTQNGKVDRSKLPEPDWHGTRDAEYTVPRNEIEEIVTLTWQKALKVSRVGIHDNYFSLGGDSIRLVQIVQELKKYNFSIGVVEVLNHPTPRKLSQFISISQHAAVAGELPLWLLKLPDQVLQSLPRDVEDAYPLSKMQELVAFHYSNDQQKMGVYHIQNSSHIYDETLSPRAFKRALEILVHRHPILRTILRTSGHEIKFQFVKKSVPFEVEEDDISHLSASEQDQYIDAAMLKDRANLFDTDSDEPLFRFKTFLRSEKSMEFFLSMHHGITDGWGQVEFMKELSELYLSLKDRRDVSLTTYANVHKEFVALEQEILSSKDTSNFWRNSLATHVAPPLNELSVSARDDSPDINECRILDADLASDLGDLARSFSVSPKAVFLSAYLDLIALHTGRDNVTIGVVSNGRSDRLSEPLKAMGLFFNIVPFCFRVDQANKVTQLEKVQRLLIDIEPYSRYPLLKILQDQGKEDLFFATMNFLHFHNLTDAKVDGGLRVLGVKIFDKFNFPLNYVVSIDPFNYDMRLRVEYDKRYFNRQAICVMIDDFTRLLREVASLR